MIYRRRDEFAPKFAPATTPAPMAKAPRSMYKITM